MQVGFADFRVITFAEVVSSLEKERTQKQ